MATEESPAILTGWKEIAGHLGVEKTTAQRWAKTRGLPVRYLPGPKGRVVADTLALDQWTTAGPVVGECAPRRSDSLPSRRNWLRYSFRGGATLVLAGLGIAGFKIAAARRRRPLAYRVEGATLTVLGEGVSVLWRYTFPEQMNEAAYEGWARQCVFDDLDDSGFVETVFHYVPKRLDAGRSLVCFSSSGKRLWEFRPGKRVADKLGREILPAYAPFAFASVHSPMTRSAKVVVTSYHKWSYADQVAVLDGKTGAVVSEYWHRGHILEMAIADLDHDGELEVMLGGVNDAPAYKQATLLVFDHRRISGSSQDRNGVVDFLGMPPGSEKLTVFFPRTPISQREEFNRVKEISVTPELITVVVAEGISPFAPTVIYQFDYSFLIHSVTISDELWNAFLALQQRRELSQTSAEVVAQNLKRDVKVLRR